jgi:hypothetical protein
MIEIKLLLCNIFSECLTIIVTTSFHTVAHTWSNIYSFVATEFPRKFVCAKLGTSALLEAVTSTGNDIDATVAVSLDRM